MPYLKRLSALLLCVLMCAGTASCAQKQYTESSSVDSIECPASESKLASASASGDEIGASSEESIVSDETPSSDESSADDKSDADSCSDTSSNDTEYSNDSEQKTIDRFTPYSPKTDYVKVWQNGEMELYNTDFRMSDALLKKFEARFSSYGNRQSVVLIELDTNMAFSFSKDTKIGTASSIKGPMGLFAYRCIDDGLISWDTNKTYQPRHFQENSTGLVQNSPYGTAFSVKTLMDYMIRISDNQAYLMIKELVGAEDFEKMMQTLGSSRIIPPGSNWGFITGWEMASVWREIYFYSKCSKSGAELFDRFMHAQYNYIWRAIPQYEAAHKSGWSGKAFNDAGVVFADGHQYVIAVLVGRNDVKDKMAQFQFVYVTKLLAELMTEYNAYLEQGAVSEISKGTAG